MDELIERLGFWIDRSGATAVLREVGGGCHPATRSELALWDALEAAREDVAGGVTADLMESDEIREKLGHLLTRTAAALKGEPPAGVWHSWHDLPERAALAVRLADDAAESVICTEGHRTDGRQWVLYPEQIAADPYLGDAIAHLEWRGLAEVERSDDAIRLMFRSESCDHHTEEPRSAAHQPEAQAEDEGRAITAVEVTLFGRACYLPADIAQEVEQACAAHAQQQGGRADAR